MYQRKIYEVAKYLTMTNHAYCEFVLAVNSGSWDRLTDEQKQIVEECANETRDELREETKQQDRECMEKLRDAGMEVYEIPPEDLPKWQEATMSVRENFIRKMGDLGRQLVDQCLAANNQ